MASAYTLFEHPSITISEDPSWTEDPYHDPSWNWDLHTMGFLLPLLQSYHATGELRYLQRAEYLILDWVRDNSGYVFEPPSVFSWNDHSTALRLLAWLSFWEVWITSPLSNDRKMETILRAVIGHAKKLATAEFYTQRHNHGIDQDIALIAIASTFPELDTSSEWLSLGVRRLRQQIAETISPNGVHLEHSPAYQLQTLEHLTQLYEFARSRRLAELADPAFGKILEKMARVMADFIQPDGRVAALGDTGRDTFLDQNHPILSKYADRDPVLRYMLTRGQSGEPSKSAVVYPREGYGILRQWWATGSDFHNSLYFLLTAASNIGLGHKHHDDLSFILFAHGQELIIDPGMYSYKQDIWRKYVVSPYAHNMIVVDGETSDTYFPRPSGKARIEASLVRDGYVFLQASQDNHPTLRHRRSVLFVRPSMFFIIDEVMPRDITEASSESLKRHRFEQLFHLAPNLEAISDDDRSRVVASLGSFKTSPLLGIVQLADGRGSAEIIRGSRDPMLGWISNGHGLLDPTPVTRFTAEGTEATFVTGIEVGARSNGTLYGLRTVDQYAARVEAGQIILRWRIRDRWHQVRISRDGRFSVKLSLIPA